MKRLVPGFLVLALISRATAEVVQSFQRCSEFFANGIQPSQPTGDEYKKICQKKDGRNEFATLYDTSRRIPVYSAYKFEKTGTCTRKDNWLIEPQLDDRNGGPNMAKESTVEHRGTHQALNGDYASSGYDKGHLVPVFHRSSQACVEATFTLTNAAPQNVNFNRGPWKTTERNIANTLAGSCLNRGFSPYVVTGVVPGSGSIKSRVNVPQYFWSAYCCIDNNAKPKLSGAYYGLNMAGSQVYSIPVAELSRKLSADYSVSDFKVFSNNCQIQGEQTPNRGTSSFTRRSFCRVKKAGKRRINIRAK